MTCGWCAHDVCHPYIISSTLYIFYHVQLSFRTLSTQMHIVHVICMLSTHVHIICLSSLTLLLYPIIHNLVSAHCPHTHTHCPCHLYVVRTCTCHLLVISNAPCIPYYPQLSFCTLSTHTHIVNVICILFTNVCVIYISSPLLLSGLQDHYR